MFPIRDTQPSYSKPVVTVVLIVVNILVFLYQFSLDSFSQNAFMYRYALIPDRFHFSNVVTSMFLHGGWMHVLGNMWFLYIFGDNVEDYLGHFKYLVFYLLCGLIAMATQVATNPASNVPTVGASGAIAGVLGAYFLLYPRARVLTWFFVFVLYLPAWIVLGEWIVIQFLSGTAALSMNPGRDVGGVAFWAHVGGFVAGMVLIKIFPERTQRSPYAYR